MFLFTTVNQNALSTIVEVGPSALFLTPQHSINSFLGTNTCSVLIRYRFVGRLFLSLRSTMCDEDRFVRQPHDHIRSDAQGYEDRPVSDKTAFRIADFDPQSIEQNDGVRRCQRAVLAVVNLRQNCVSAVADKVSGQRQVMNFFKTSTDIAGRQASGIKPDNLVNHPVNRV